MEHSIVLHADIHDKRHSYKLPVGLWNAFVIYVVEESNEISRYSKLFYISYGLFWMQMMQCFEGVM